MLLALCLWFGGCSANKTDGSDDSANDSATGDSGDGSADDSAGDSGDSADCPEPTPWYADADADGYGAGTAVDACTQPAGRVAEAGDCDDGNQAIFPGAVEVCDGLDNDCDPATLEAGLAATVDATGAWVDDTASWVGGTKGAPRIVSIGGGAWNLCASTWLVRLDVVGASVVRGRGVVVLSGEGVGTVVNVHGADAELALSGVTISGGRSSVSASSGGTGGGGLACGDGARVTLADAVIVGNEAGIGGGVLVDDCALDGTGLSLTGNHATYGGGLYLLGGSVALEGTSVTGNVADTSGGGLGAEGVTAPVLLDLVDTVVGGNTAHFGGGLVLYEAATATCTGTGTASAAFSANAAVEAGGGVYMTGGDADPVLDVVAYDFGEGAEDNSPSDVTTNAGDFAFGDGATFTCSNAGCEGG